MRESIFSGTKNKINFFIKLGASSMHPRKNNDHNLKVNFFCNRHEHNNKHKKSTHRLINSTMKKTMMEVDACSTSMKDHDRSNKIRYFTHKFIQKYENLFGKNRKNMIHYKYVGRPVYKLLGGSSNPLLSVPASFITMDYLFHQLPIHFYKQMKSQNGDFSFRKCIEPNLAWTVLWANLSLPIAFKKFYNLKHSNSERSHMSSQPLINPSRNRFQLKSSLENKSTMHHFFSKRREILLPECKAFGDRSRSHKLNV